MEQARAMPCRPPFPASIVNPIPYPLGIPNRVNAMSSCSKDYWLFTGKLPRWRDRFFAESAAMSAFTSQVLLILAVVAPITVTVAITVTVTCLAVFQFG
jgi:hypothetical protein